MRHQVEIFFGRDELLLEALALGARGAVGSFYSVIPGLFQQLIASYRNGETQQARQLADRTIHYIETTVDAAPLVASKFLLAQQGFLASRARPPLTTFDAAAGQRLLEQLEGLG